MSQKAQVIVVDVDKVPAEQGPAVAKRLDERRKSIGDNQMEGAVLTRKLSAAGERREQAIKEIAGKAAEHVKSVEESALKKEENRRNMQEELRKSLKEKQETAEKKAKEALAAKKAGGLTEYMKVLNLSAKASVEEPKAA